MLALSVGLGVWLLYNQRESTQRIVEAQKAVLTMSEEMTKLREGILKYPRVEAEVRQSQTEENPAVVQQKVYDALSKEVGVDSKVLQQKLPDVAINLQRAPDATTYEKANAA